jgi:hypothetical protein
MERGLRPSNRQDLSVELKKIHVCGQDRC